MNYGLSGKVVMVTGGARGLGRCIVEEFLKSEATVVFVDLLESGKDVEAELAQQGKVEFLKMDITKEDDVNSTMDYIVQKYGKLDCLINNAAVTTTVMRGMIDESFDFVSKTMHVNVCGTYLCMSAAIKRMIDTGVQGSIVNVSSVVAVQNYNKTNEGMVAYCASKAAVNRLTAIAAVAYGEYGIRINAVMPGAMATESLEELRIKSPENYAQSVAAIPLMQKVSEPSEIARVIVYLCSDEVPTATGLVLPVDGGVSL